MGNRNKEKAAALLVGAAAAALSFLHPDYAAIGIYRGCAPEGRFLYPFFHAGIVHAALNAWCLVGIVFVHGITLRRMLLAWLAAASVPAFLLPSAPTVGLSGVVFFLFGSVSFTVKRRLSWQGWMAFYLAAGFLFHAMNGTLHLYCYLAGILWGFLNKPYVKK